MRQPTEMMRAILKHEMSQRIIDFVSPIYGKSYVALWVYEAIGAVVGEVYNKAQSLLQETNPATADLLLDYWEDHYGIPRDSSLNTEQRRNRIIVRTQSGGPCNPTVLAAAVSSAIGGIPVDIQENIAKNTFLVNIREYIENITPAVAIVERMKPAHLIYQIRVATQMISEEELKIAIAVTHAELNKVEVQQ